MDAHSLQLHHTHHHGAYTEQFNRVVKNWITGKKVTNASKYPETIRNTGEDTLIINYSGKCGPCEGTAAFERNRINAITGDFGLFDAFRESFTRSANSVPSEGWTWLIYSNSRLKITSTTGNNSPVDG